jgi:hypothetical protein
MRVRFLSHCALALTAMEEFVPNAREPLNAGVTKDEAREPDTGDQPPAWSIVKVTRALPSPPTPSSPPRTASNPSSPPTRTSPLALTLSAPLDLSKGCPEGENDCDIARATERFDTLS